MAKKSQSPKVVLSLSYKEVKIFKKWVKSHVKDCLTAQWPHAKIEFTVTSESGIGLVTIAKCPCGESKDITDVSCW